MAPSEGRGGDLVEGAESASVTRCARSDRICRTRRHPNNEARPAAPSPAARSAGEGRSRRVDKQPVEMRGKGAPAHGGQEKVPTCGCGCHIARYLPRRPGEGTSAAGAEDTPRRPVSADSTVLGFKGGGRGVQMSRGGGPTDESVARCGFLNPPTPPRMGAAASCIPVATGARGGGGGRGHRDVYIYGCTSRPHAPDLHGPTADLPEEDTATVKMERMEEGHLAKIVQGDGAKEIKVGEVICVIVEQGDIDKFKDYKPSAADAPAAPSESKAPEPAEPKVEEKVPAKANNEVQLSSVKRNGPDARILKADIEDYLASVAKGGKCELFAASGLDYTGIPNAQIRKGGTFTVSNLGGPFGIRQFSAIVNPPQSAILAIGSGGHDDKKVMIPTQHALSVNMDSNGENEISWEKEGSHPFSEVPDFVCSDSGGCFGKSNYISKMNYYLRADCVSDINPISDKEVRSSDSRYEVLKAICCDLAVVPALLSTCASIKSSAVDTVTQIFVDICGLTISLQKNLSQLDIKKLTEAAFVRAGIKPSDFYSTFAGKVLEPNRLLSCYQIPRDSIIRLNARLRGGCAGNKTWDDIIRSQQRYVTVSLPPADLVVLRPDGSAQQGPVLVKYLAPLMQFRSRQVLIQLCRKHYTGTSYGGNITSKNILFDPDGNVRFNSAPEKFTQHSGKLDYEAIGTILDNSLKDTVNPIYPMHFYQLVDFLRYAPAVDCQCEAVIAFVTNHVSLRSHYVRVTISELLVQLVERLPKDVLTALLAALDKIVWGNTVKKVAAMDHTYHYHSRTNQSGVWVPYVDHGVSYLKFSNNFFKHHNWASLEKLEAAFSLVMAHKWFLPRFLFTILVTLKHTQNQCPALIQSFIDQVVDMLGNNVIDLERG